MVIIICLYVHGTCIICVRITHIVHGLILKITLSSDNNNSNRLQRIGTLLHRLRCNSRILCVMFPCLVFLFRLNGTQQQAAALTLAARKKGEMLNMIKMTTTTTTMKVIITCTRIYVFARSDNERDGSAPVCSLYCCIRYKLRKNQHYNLLVTIHSSVITRWHSTCRPLARVVYAFILSAFFACLHIARVKHFRLPTYYNIERPKRCVNE